MAISSSDPSLPLATMYQERSLPEQRQILQQHYTACRHHTLEFAQDLSEQEYYCQAHPDFSPIGWHLGHIALVESLWILEHLGQQPGPDQHHRRLFAADGLPKAERQRLPDRSRMLDHLAGVRQRLLTYLDSASLEPHHRLWWWLLQHESQHLETMGLVRTLHRWEDREIAVSQGDGSGWETPASSPTAEAYFPPGPCTLGSAGVDAIDNEQPPHTVVLKGFWLDTCPVTQGAFQRFMEAGGYGDRRWWSAAGWQWLQAHPVSQPRYWHPVAGWEQHPVCGVSYYEADAYATFVGKRLPTEAEWERAAAGPATARTPYPWGQAWPTGDRGNFGHRVGHTTAVGQYPSGQSPEGCTDLLGNVWEWTSSWFDGYPGFTAFPYRGYSQAYFDRQHRVLRGGSWATLPWGLRSSLRNWYYPHVRQIFAGFRCARDAA